MTQLTIATCFPLSSEQRAEMKGWLPDSVELIVSDHDRIREDIRVADIYWGHAKGEPIDWPEVVAGGRLKWIQSTAAGLDHCLHPAVRESSIRVSGCSGLFADQVAEQTLALLFGLIRRLPQFFRAQQNRRYERQPTDNLWEKTVGIVGLGGNGRRIAEVLAGLCERRIATDCFPHFDPLDGVECRGADELDWLLGEADVVIVTLPFTPETEGRLGRSCFERIKRGSYLVNVGRGSVIETEALMEALRAGKLQGAGLDVVDPEPLPPDHPLWECEGVLITPHVGAQSPRRVPMTLELIRRNWDRFQNDRRLINEVAKELGFPRPEDRWRGE